MQDELITWLIERLDRGTRRALDASTPQGYVFEAVDTLYQGSWLITARPKPGMGDDLPRRVFELMLSEVK
jgi:hypothetical protein